MSKEEELHYVLTLEWSGSLAPVRISDTGTLHVQEEQSEWEIFDLLMDRARGAMVDEYASRNDLSPEAVRRLYPGDPAILFWSLKPNRRH